MRKLSFKEIDIQTKYVLEKFSDELMEKVIDISGFFNNFRRIFLEHIERNNIDILIDCDHIIGTCENYHDGKLPTYLLKEKDNDAVRDRFNFCPECGEKLGE